MKRYRTMDALNHGVERNRLSQGQKLQNMSGKERRHNNQDEGTCGVKDTLISAEDYMWKEI